jgi:hypothetical protein
MRITAFIAVAMHLLAWAMVRQFLVSIARMFGMNTLLTINPPYLRLDKTDFSKLWTDSGPNATLDFLVKSKSE